ncbi:hypothetical protein [Aeromonas rivipollensis]|uniref:hypothetical protein n=1 Tax=Aeromonas rivipollensis TaxID=948519 RepID=UPI00196A2961|nr:hypothetical protein [Aeromonas rivipollensis]
MTSADFKRPPTVSASTLFQSKDVLRMNKRMKQRERQGAGGCTDLGAGWLRRLLSVCSPVPGDLFGRIAKQLAKRRDEVRDMAVTRVLGGLLTLDAVARDSGQFQG